MVLKTIWASTALLPLLTANALIFEPSSRPQKRQSQHHRLAQKAKRAAVPVLPATWSYNACYTDGGARTLNAAAVASDTMTIEYCVNYCDTNNYVIAGVEYSKECYCDNTIKNGGAVVTDGCDMMCGGDPTQVCGGGNRLSVYKSTKTPPAGPTHLQTYSNWGFQGCYTDNINGRALTTPMGIPNLTPQKCMDACHNANFLYAGMEYAGECYCGNSIVGGNHYNADQSACNMPCNGDANHYCGAGNLLSLYQYGAPVATGAPSTTSATATATQSVAPPAAPTVVQTYNGWGSQGCYVDGLNGRALPVGMAVTGGAAAMTVEKCLDACHNAGYTYAGLEYAQECFCGNTAPTVPATDGRCDMTCKGDATEYCGGGNGLNVYLYGSGPATQNPTGTTTSTGPTTTPAGPSVLSDYAGYVSQGCYVEGINGRVLPAGVPVAGGAAAMTVEKCITACQNAGYTVAGLEYAQECWCGNTMPTVADTGGHCDMTCKGDAFHYCGGGNALNVYLYGGSTVTSTTPTTTATATTSTATGPAPTGPSVLPSYGNWVSQGCWSDQGNPRSLPNGVAVTGAMTPQKCMDKCYASGYQLAGVEYGGECYCGNAAGGASVNDGCTMLCNGDQNLYCGGPNRLNLYSYNGVVPPPAGGGDPGNPGAVGPVTSGLPGNWHYVNCYVDNAFGGRILKYGIAPSQTNTVQSCIATCDAAGYTLSGTEFGVECYCGNALYNGAAVATSDAQCDDPCAGDATHACGAGNRISLYASVAQFDTHPVPVPLTTGLYKEFVYRGCWDELGPPNPPTFPNKLTDTAGNAPLKCMELCSTYGFDAAGLEYGEECWCGSATDLAEKGATQTTENECAIPCPGDPDHLCGGTGKFTLYTWPNDGANPLYVWHDPPNKGHYEFLIGGLIIPLIATLGINNKVTLLEKFGTGPPNSTGAYELDYTLASDPTKAHREMHVVSDVFCAANLVLPDKAGRVLSIGGWSFESTYGIRLYTPSGSLGVNGTTDWEEHYDEVHLQQGRWYPGAMTMTNGSILVIGGEEGSNGYPIPTIEILPTPAGGPTYLEMDWLRRTDPNNLYPFSFVMPNGGILVVYYNEARIIDEVNFQTIKTLPTIPGRVGHGGGRTYPLEGTAMVLPQHAPYTDPIEILVCGGSDFGEALDNCVTTQPEAANPTWTIERMPTRRVMTIMAALPDGTFIIMGGAQGGVAGFGLGVRPNLSALLYDPKQPLGQRFSKLGNTILPRMYHSEATLLHDGRVLVTGSDPEDGVNPQEYRYEVYVPPYLTKGIPQPTYTIQNKEWQLGGEYTAIVTSTTSVPSGNTWTLIGGSSSTHGATFGQRTYFPEFSCTGTICKIKAPPTVHICPPGWYMLFYLDQGVPSFSQWVRIGGDPGSIGNWPNTGSFVLPGV